MELCRVRMISENSVTEVRAPPGKKPHRYIFHLYSTLSDPTLPAGMDKKELLVALGGRILEEKTFTLSYKRTR
jgi:phosphatidylethanolamine-binding protein (PEBP) family uncharacterized protein